MSRQHSRRSKALKTQNAEGAVLLEVVLALVLFVGAATVISSAFNASLRSLERLRLNTRASNFSATVLAELQIGIRPLATAGPEPFPIPDEAWSWEIVVGPSEEQFTSTSQLKRVEVIVRHSESGLVYRLAQLLTAPVVEDDEELFFTQSEVLNELGAPASLPANEYNQHNAGRDAGAPRSQSDRLREDRLAATR